MSEHSALSDWVPLAVILSALVALITLVWNIGRSGRDAINARINNLERTQDDDRKQAQQLEIEVALNYVSKRDHEAGGNRVENSLNALTREINQLKSFLMERGVRP